MLLIISSEMFSGVGLNVSEGMGATLSQLDPPLSQRFFLTSIVIPAGLLGSQMISKRQAGQKVVRVNSSSSLPASWILN